MTAGGGEAAAMVPWITSWSGEEGFGVRPCRYVGNRLALWQPFAPGSGRPVFKSRHAVRARKAVAEGLCSICGEGLDTRDLWLFPNFKQLRQRDGSVRYAANEPPVHKACADLALEHCPHIRRERWTPFHFTGTFGRFDLLDSGASLNAVLGIQVQPGASIVVGAYLTVPRETFEAHQRRSAA